MKTGGFTVDQANALVPVMEEVLGRIRMRAEELRRRHDQVQVLDALWGEKLADTENPDHDEFVEHRDAILRVAGEIEEIVEAEIVARGVRFPQGGIEHGLLDFPTTLDGRVVYLCWQSGEGEVRAWHELDAGYAGRQPITAELALRMGR